MILGRSFHTNTPAKILPPSNKPSIRGGFISIPTRTARLKSSQSTDALPRPINTFHSMLEQSTRDRLILRDLIDKGTSVAALYPPRRKKKNPEYPNHSTHEPDGCITYPLNTTDALTSIFDTLERYRHDADTQNASRPITPSFKIQPRLHTSTQVRMPWVKY